MSCKKLAFGATVNQGLQGLGSITDESHQGRIDPSPCLDTVQTANDQLELHVEVVILVLDFAGVRRNRDALDAALHESCRDVGLGFADVGFAEEKLAVEVRNIDGICYGELSEQAFERQTYPCQ